MIGVIAISNNSNIQIEYGYLYNWYSITGGTLAPIGWHVPTLTEVNTLKTYLVSNTAGKLKSTNNIYWDSPNSGATNITGFNSIGTGIRLGGSYLWRKTDAVYSTQTNYNTPFEEYNGWVLYNDDNEIYITNPQYFNGLAVRCIKDDSTNPHTVTDYDGNVYLTVKIGDQVWMAGDLRVKHYRDGTSIPNIYNNDFEYLTTGAYCIYGQTNGSTVNPTVETTSVSNIRDTYAYVLCNITSIGDSSILDCGVIVSLNVNFSSYTVHSGWDIDDPNNSNVYVFVGGLTNHTRYYVRSYAKNSAGTSYGYSLNFLTFWVNVGDLYGGGIVAYLWKPGEVGYTYDWYWDANRRNVLSNGIRSSTGYIEGECHGIICSTHNSVSVWSPYSTIFPPYVTGLIPTYTDGSDDSTLSPLANYSIFKGYGWDSTLYAALYCNVPEEMTYSIDMSWRNGYNDWILPTESDMFKLYLNVSLLNSKGANLGNVPYWTSTAENLRGPFGIGLQTVGRAHTLNPQTGSLNSPGETVQTNLNFKPIRYF